VPEKHHGRQGERQRARGEEGQRRWAGRCAETSPAVRVLGGQEIDENLRDERSGDRGVLPLLLGVPGSMDDDGCKEHQGSCGQVPHRMPGQLLTGRLRRRPVGRAACARSGASNEGTHHLVHLPMPSMPGSESGSADHPKVKAVRGRRGDSREIAPTR
jgi:hypothetical protein